MKSKNPYIINDDKPAIRLVNGNIYIYGTPFSGEDDINENEKARLKAISFINKSENNSIKKLNNLKALKKFWDQSMNNLSREELTKFLEVFEIVYKNIPIYDFSCNISKEAFNLSYETMTNKKYW